MIEGVNVLNTYDIVKPEGEEMALLSFLGCCIAVCLVVIIIYVWSFSKQKGMQLCLALFVVFSYSLAFLWLFAHLLIHRKLDIKEDTR